MPRAMMAELGRQAQENMLAQIAANGGHVVATVHDEVTVEPPPVRFEDEDDGYHD